MFLCLEEEKIASEIPFWTILQQDQGKQKILTSFWK